MKKQRGITLIGLVVTIIILLILAGVTVITLTGDNGLLTKAGSTKKENLRALIREKIQVESEGLETERQLKSKTDREIFEEIQERLNLEETQYQISSKSMIITTKEGYIFTVLYDGTVKDGKFACLDIADGSIQLKETGYVQGTISNVGESYGNPYSTITGDFIEYSGNYVISGTTTENIIKISDKGNYNVTIKDLNIDVSGKTAGYCAFIANSNTRETNVVINVEGNNYLKSCSGAGLSFSTNIPNIDGETNGSTLTLQGNGKLEAIGAAWSAGIGGNYSGRSAVCNITINSGTIIATGNGHGAGIGGSLRRKSK